MKPVQNDANRLELWAAALVVTFALGAGYFPSRALPPPAPADGPSPVAPVAPLVRPLNQPTDPSGHSSGVTALSDDRDVAAQRRSDGRRPPPGASRECTSNRFSPRHRGEEAPGPDSFTSHRRLMAAWATVTARLQWGADGQHTTFERPPRLVAGFTLFADPHRPRSPPTLS